MLLFKVDTFGQIDSGDTLYLDTTLGHFKAEAKIICFKGENTEEVVIHKGRNHYFILDMVFDKSSWVKDIWVLKFDKKYKPYRKGNVKNL